MSFVISPDKTALIPSALRDATERRVSAGGRSVRVITLPSGSVTDRGLSIFFKYILFTPFQVFPKTLCPQGLKGRYRRALVRCAHFPIF